MTDRRFKGFSSFDFRSLPVDFDFAAFRACSPLDGDNIWEFLLERHGERITVKRRETALENLEKIFRATFRLANTIGFQAMTLRDLCRETGLSMGGLYGYIDAKDSLAEMIEDVIREASLRIPDAFGHVEAPLDRLECMLRAHIYLAELLQPWFYFVFLESRALPQKQREIAKESELHAQSRVAALLDAAGVRPVEQAQLLAAHCMVLAQDWHLKRWKFRAAEITPDAFADSVVRLVRARAEA